MNLKKQEGVALIVVMILLVLAASSYLLRRTPHQELALNADKNSEIALARAKLALIGWAMGNAARPGELPCPDTNNDGLAENTCTPAPGSQMVRGRLPWKNLSLPDSFDIAQERLWYAVSADFSPATSKKIDAGTAGQLALDSTNKLVALVIAPGRVLIPQTGRPNNTVSNYLEDDNADNDNIFVSLSGSAFNDHILKITESDLSQVNFSGGKKTGKKKK